MTSNDSGSKATAAGRAATSNLPKPALLRDGANLPPELWNDARITAAMRLLPREMDTMEISLRIAALIHYFSTCQRYDLDPFSGEIHGWWDDKAGRFIVMVGRDGLLKIGATDPDFIGVTTDVIREGDIFRRRQEGDRVILTHESDLMRKPPGAIIGGYALVRKREGADKFVYHAISDFKHLLGKKNWLRNKSVMIETRCQAEAIRLSTPKASGIYTEPDLVLVDADASAAAMEEVTQSAKMAERLAPPETALPYDLEDAEIVREDDAPVSLDASHADVDHGLEERLEVSSSLPPGFYLESPGGGLDFNLWAECEPDAVGAVLLIEQQGDIAPVYVEMLLSNVSLDAAVKYAEKSTVEGEAAPEE